MTTGRHYGTIHNLPVWECDSCKSWQVATDETGRPIEPGQCECGSVRHTESIGIINAHKPIVLGMMAMGRRFSSHIEQWATR